METTRKFAPEALAGLRRFLGALPWSVRSVVLQFNWQRSGCIGCHQPDHSIYDCPHVARERSAGIARDACYNWCGVIGEELLLLAASSSSDSYVAASEARIKSRARPPFHFRRKAGKKASAVQQQQSDAREVPPTLNNEGNGFIQRPDKADRAQQQGTSSAKPSALKPSAVQPQRQGAAAAKSSMSKPFADQPQRKDAAGAKPNASKSSAHQPQRQGPASKAKQNAPKLPDGPILPLPALLPITKPLLPTPPKTGNPNRSKHVLFIGSKPAKQPTDASPRGSSNATATTNAVGKSTPDKGKNTAESDWHVCAGDEWDVNRVAMDTHGRTAGDLAMAQAKLCGSRRGRPASPTGSPNPSKFICISDDQEDGDYQVADSRSFHSIAASLPSQDLVAPLQSQDSAVPLPSQDLAVPLASQKATGSQTSKDLSATPSQHLSRKVDYDTVDLKRYQHFITLESRRRFWDLASEAAKQRVTAEILQLSPDSNTLKQARAQGWIPKDGEQNA